MKINFLWTACLVAITGCDSPQNHHSRIESGETKTEKQDSNLLVNDHETGIIFDSGDEQLSVLNDPNNLHSLANCDQLISLERSGESIVLLIQSSDVFQFKWSTWHKGDVVELSQKSEHTE